MRLVLLQQDPEVLDHFPGAPVIVDNVAQDLPDFADVLNAAREEPLRGLCIAENRGQRLIQFVGNRARQFSKHCHSGEVCEFPAQQSRLPVCAVLLAEGDWITPAELPDSLRDSAPELLALKPALEQFERRHIRRVLEMCDGNKVEASQHLDVHLATLYRHLERLGLSE